MRDHYAALAAGAYLRTPSKIIDDTFRASLFNLEWSWVRPFGWTEAIHHWGTMYTQQHTVGTDWLGQTDRSREMLLSHADRLYPDGRVPDLHPGGHPRKDFPWNQFYLWAAQHNWRHTADRDLLKRLATPLGRALDYLFAAYDPDDNFLLGYGQQIGNQEDYVSTPGDGSSPTIAGIELNRFLADVANVDGRPVQAAAYAEKARRMLSALRAELWRPDLGRFIYYRDGGGISHIEGQYHTLIWPVMFDVLEDPTDQYTSLRHLYETLTGSEGETYVSNNFPRHVKDWTVGAQAGGQQQPWSTIAWAHLGDGDRALTPLEWTARQVMPSPADGVWPEVSGPWPAYFSPPAGVFIWGVVEGLFGLRVDVPRGILEVAPAVPASWPGAELHLPDYQIKVDTAAGSLRVELTSKQALERRFRLPVPPSSAIEVRVDGTNVPFRTEPGILRHFVTFSIPRTQSSVVEVRYTSVPFSPPPAPQEVSPRQRWEVPWSGPPIVAVRDPEGILELSQIDPNDVTLQLRQGVAVEALDYGSPGLRLLTDRDAFLEASAPAGKFLVPVDLRVVPELRFSSPPSLSKEGAGFVLDLPLEPSTRGAREPIFVDLGNGHRLEVPNGSERVALKEDVLADILPCRHPIEVVFSDGRTLPGEVDTHALFQARADLAAKVTRAGRAVPLPKAFLQPDSSWKSWREWSAYMHPHWVSSEPPLAGTERARELRVPSCEALAFENPHRRVAVVSSHLKRPEMRIDLTGKARKVALLILPMLDNHDPFAPVGRVTVHASDGAVFTKTLHLPGDVGWWNPTRIVHEFSTVRSDWAKSATWEAPSSVMNVIELDLGRTRSVDWMSIETIGPHPALGVVAVSLID